MTDQYRLKTDGFKKIRKQIILRTIPTALISMAVGIAIPTFNVQGPQNQADVLPMVILICCVAGGVGIYKGINRQKRLFESYTLRFLEDGIAREQSDTPTIKILYNEVNAITKDRKGNFVIKGEKAIDAIGVPYLMDHYEQLEIRLNQIRPVETTSQWSFDQKYKIPVLLLTLGSMAAVGISNNKIVVGLSGSLLTGILVWSFIEIQRNKNIDAKTKRGSYLVVLVVASIIGTMILKLRA